MNTYLNWGTDSLIKEEGLISLIPKFKERKCVKKRTSKTLIGAETEKCYKVSGWIFKWKIGVIL